MFSNGKVISRAPTDMNVSLQVLTHPYGVYNDSLHLAKVQFGISLVWFRYMGGILSEVGNWDSKMSLKLRHNTHSIIKLGSGYFKKKQLSLLKEVAVAESHG